MNTSTIWCHARWSRNYLLGSRTWVGFKNLSEINQRLVKDVAIEAYKGEQWPSRAEHLERLARLGISGSLNPWTRARKTTVYSCRHIPTAFQDSIRSVLLLCTDVFRSLHKTVRALNALELKLIYSLIHNNELMISHGWPSASVSRSKAAQAHGCDELHVPSPGSPQLNLRFWQLHKLWSIVQIYTHPNNLIPALPMLPA